MKVYVTKMVKDSSPPNFHSYNIGVFTDAATAAYIGAEEMKQEPEYIYYVNEFDLDMEPV